METTTLHKRGDLSPDGKKRFWNYQKQILKRTGARGERWILTDRYEQYRLHQNAANDLCSARREFKKMQQNKNN